MPSQFRVLITDRAWPDCDVERRILAEIGAEVVEAPDSQESTLIRLAADVDAIATCWATVSPAVIREAMRCRVIARFGIGLDNICVQTATEQGIPVTYVPDYCVSEVADHTLGLLLALARNIGWYHYRTKTGRYERQAAQPMRRLSGQVLGVVGLGRIARAVLPKARALGLKVLAHSHSGDDYGTECRMVSFERLLAESDFLSLHLPLSEETRGLLGVEELVRMKRTAYVINTSRGGLIDHEALWAALRRNEIAGAALDVFDPEPPDLSHPLFQDERVIATPHAAFLSEESLHELRERTARQVLQALQGGKPEHVVNPHVYKYQHLPSNDSA